MEIVDTEPRSGEDHPANDPIRVFFDGYLDPSIDWSRVARLRSAELDVSARVTYDPVDRALVLVPDLDLRPDLGYSVTVFGGDDGLLRSVDGRTLAQAEFTVSFVARRARAGRPGRTAVDFQAEIAPIFADRCGCHGPAPAAYPELSPTALVDQPSLRQPGRILVQPGEALASYLVQRVLEAYPGTRGLAMPPDAPLSDAELRRIVSWVEGLE